MPVVDKCVNYERCLVMDFQDSKGELFVTLHWTDFPELKSKARAESVQDVLANPGKYVERSVLVFN